jgi:hypothetical protein
MTASIHSARGPARFAANIWTLQDEMALSAPRMSGERPVFGWGKRGMVQWNAICLVPPPGPEIAPK